VRPKGLGKLVECNYLIESRIRDLPACSIVPQPLLYCYHEGAKTDMETWRDKFLERRKEDVFMFVRLFRE
jgi:hypothetical protein